MQKDLENIKKIREQTSASIADIKNALAIVHAQKNIDPDKVIQTALEILKKKGLDKAASKGEREVKAGLVETYSHGGKVGVLIELLCETDFVARTQDFKNLAHELALQIASMSPSSVEELLSQEYIRDHGQTVDQLIKGVVGKLGENIRVGQFARIALDE